MKTDEFNSPHPLERKLVTILSADVAEYSRLMAEDEEQTLNTFRAQKQIFESLVALHHGRVFNTAGDAILAEFGSTVEAVRCATEVQAALGTRNDQLPRARQIRFRIGVTGQRPAGRRGQHCGPIASTGRARGYLHFRWRL